METILVTGGAGYIGSHTLIALYKSGYKAVVIDNLANSVREALTRTEKIIGESIPFYEADVRNETVLQQIFDENSISAVIHFAGLKAVGESVEMPLEYYDVNLNTTISLLKVMRDNGCKRIVFSSSATVYGLNNISPLHEDLPTSCTNPYGWTKYMNEQILRDVCAADESMSAVLLRYFNPIGAHESGTIGENPKGIPNNLMPYITQVAVGKLEYLRVFGDDYDTPDGTGVRDYIHVMDLARGHVKALSYSADNQGSIAINLGTGNGYSVLDLVRAFEKASGVEIPYRIIERRPGDVGSVYADASLAKAKLDWSAEYDVDKMCADSWHWQSSNPNGYSVE
ncbi:MAG: UDP-glucose 4-epimerase GalE [Clostridiaceae bacterium]|nr:UDP-glucose 4-epimerase GalE [Clostridiaceae bacterium]